MNRSNVIPAGEVADRLADQVDRLVRELLPAAVREGNARWRVGGLHGAAGQSLSIPRSGDHVGQWQDFKTGEFGDLLDLVREANHFASGGDGTADAKAYAWALSWLGLDGRNPGALKQTRDARERRQADAARRQERGIGSEDEHKLKIAKGIFFSAAPFSGSPAADYLRGRGIDFEKVGHAPGCLRFHPETYHPETKRNHPAMVALVAREGEMDGKRTPFVGIHRTYLERRRDGTWGKLSGVRKPKLCLGPVQGGCIRLWKGGVKKKSLGQAPEGQVIDVGEGIEDCCVPIMVNPGLWVVSGLSLSNMGGVVLREDLKVRILAQNDPPGSPAERHFHRMMERRAQGGRRVDVARPPRQFKDWNDWWMAEIRSTAA